MISLLFSNPTIFFLFATIFVISLTIHEFSHAFVAYKLGDSTAKYQGRLTLNPLAHLDPVGTLMILLVRFGWGKPVPINATNFKQPRRDSALVAIAGPVSNISLAILMAILAKLLPPNVVVYGILQVVAVFNLTLAFFNLLPFYPLDGFNVVYGILPFDLAWQFKDTARYGIFVLLILMVTGSIGFFISAPIDFLLRLLGF